METYKAIIICEFDDQSLYDKLGTHIKWHNDNYNVNWRIKRVPNKMKVDYDTISSSEISGKAIAIG